MPRRHEYSKPRNFSCALGLVETRSIGKHTKFSTPPQSGAKFSSASTLHIRPIALVFIASANCLFSEVSALVQHKQYNFKSNSRKKALRAARDLKGL